MKIEKNAVVSVHYTLTDDDGQTLDSSAGSDPLVYLHGASNLIPGLEKEMTDRTVGDAFKCDIAPEDAYGLHSPEKIETVPKAMFQGVDEIEPGMVFQSQGEDGTVQSLTVSAVTGDEISVDRNHPLAGKTLHFDIQVVDVREGTEEEISHGHPH